MGLDNFFGGGRMRRATPAEIARLKKGGHRARQMNRQHEKVHAENDVPRAEKLLETSLRALSKNAPTSLPKKEERGKTSFWNTITEFWKTVRSLFQKK